jgi:Protein of unknown function (DUF3501)
MEPVRLEEILGHERYGVVREAVRRGIIEHKRSRRVTVGDHISLLFEDRATVWYQTQEMIWVEHITDLDAIREELAVYDALLPGPSELSATLLIEIADQSRIREELAQLIGIDRHVWLEVGTEYRVPAIFDEGRQTAEKLSAVQFVRFGLDGGAEALAAGGAPLAVAVDHPAYRHRAPLSDDVRRSLVSDLTDASAAEAALRCVRDG